MIQHAEKQTFAGNDFHEIREPFQYTKRALKNKIQYKNCWY
jgi:hypothetical protein